MQMPPLVIAEHPADGGMVCLAVSGELDLASAEDLEEAVAVAAGRAGVREVCIELSGVTFLDAAGIAALIRARAAAMAANVLVRANGARGVAARVLAVTGVGEWLGSR
ncbi:STAS domain-containing protein [Actinoplanes sp. NPDC049316]|uniref:STAS domain-containing protein n=1 Tax=Actinoplanes sp. NPDC049316 TaxID=3154727 RepID=UPI003438EC31